MEKYVNKDTILENDIFKIFESSIICPVCENIYINPNMCMKCQKVFCKGCIDKLNKNEVNNIHNCKDPSYISSPDKKDILSKLKFICVGCKEEFFYNDMENHHESCCPGKISDRKILKKDATKKKLQLVSKDEMAKLKK